MDTEKNQSWHHYREAISSSAKLVQRGYNEGALRLLDGAIAMASKDNDRQWVLALSHHAAVISNFFGDLSRVRHYYEHSLAFNPENPRALSGLADVAKEEGELGLANEYAARCYKVLMEGDDSLKEARLGTLLKKWPDLPRLKP